MVFASAEEFLQSDAPASAICLITDVRMPGIDGLELQRRVGIKYPRLPVILITARDEEYARGSIKGKGARHLFRKPFDGRELLAALATILKPGEQKQ